MGVIDSKRYMAVHLKGKKQPLFWVQAGLEQAKVLQELDREQPVYCLYRLKPDPNERSLRFEEIAAYHIETMRALSPQGPYALAGYCVCATIVFEMASQLRNQGETVSALILIDPLDASVTRAELIQEPVLFRLGFHFNRVLFHLQRIKDYSARDKLAYCVRSARGIKARLESNRAGRSRDAGSGRTRALPQHVLLDVHDSDMYAIHQYVPKPYGGSAILLRPSVSSPRVYDYPNRRWAQLVRGGLHIHKVPGDSDSMWLMPDAGGMAKAIDSCLAQIQGVLTARCSYNS